MKIVVIVSMVIVAAIVSGCTGMEIGGKVWVSRVDERQESQKTHNVPLKCYLWENCAESNNLASK